MLFSEDSVSTHRGLTLGREGKGRERRGEEGRESPPSSAALQKPSNGSLNASERISLEKEAKELKAWLKSNRQDNYTDQEAETRRQKRERLTKIERATHIPL
jgi:hypothetical protein